MDSNVYTYFQRRRDFGKPTHFVDSSKIYDLLTWPVPSWDNENKFLKENPHEQRNPNFINLSNLPTMSEHTVNTERVNMDTKKMFHYEGGWPLEVDITEEKARHNHIRKKLEKTHEGLDIFIDSCRRMCKGVKDIIKMNNQIDMYEEYFDGEKSDNNIEKLSVKTSMLFKDPERDSSSQKRCINKISWHPDGPNKLAGAYCIMRFQKAANETSCKSYVWDLKSPNAPTYCMEPPSPICSLSYNHKNTDEIAFGCYNGRVGFCDVRDKKIDAAKLSDVEHSHHEPVVDVIWLSSKLNNEFVTVSTDGQLLWWDNRQFGAPTDKQYICEFDGNKGEDGIPLNLIGGTCLEFVPDHGPKYLIGTEKGSIMLATKKPKKKPEIGFNVSYGLQFGRHLGPIYSIKRNPFNYKYFLSIGDWSVNLWEEETKAPIMKTRYHSSYLTDGCWAPNRPGVFFVTRKDGWLDIWDFYYRQNEVAFSHKVSNAALTAIKLNTVTGSSQIGVTHSDTGKYAAIGDNNGTITLLELCKTLYEAQPQEKEVLTEIFEREKKREEHLKMQRLLFDNRKKAAQKEKEMLEKQQEAAAKVDVNKQMSDIETKFEGNLKKAADDLYKVYINDPEMTALLTERLAHGTEKKASKDVAHADEAIVTKPKVPADYDKKAESLSVSSSNLYKPSKDSYINTFLPTSSDTLVAAAVRNTNGRDQCKILSWKLGVDQGDKEIFAFDKDVKPEIGENKKDHQGQPIEVETAAVQDLVFIAKDYKGRYVVIDTKDKLIVCDVDESKGVITNVKSVHNCLSAEKCCAQMSRDKKFLYYIDKGTTVGLMWRFDIAGNKVEPIQVLPDKPLNEIVGMCLSNDETIILATNGGIVGRYDINKRSFERSIKFEGKPQFVCSHLNYVAVCGYLKNPLSKGDSPQVDVILLDSELREVAEYVLPESTPVVWISMKLSVAKFPVIICATAREMFALKINKDRSMTRLKMDLNVVQLSGGDGLHSFHVYKNDIFVSNKENIMGLQVKGDLDDAEKMEELAEKLEEVDDNKREAEDKRVAQKSIEQAKAAKEAEAEAARKKKEEEEAKKRREEEIAKELDPTNHQVSFAQPNMVYNKVNGPRFDKFTVADQFIYTLTEEGRNLSIKKFSLKDINTAPVVLLDINDRVTGSMSYFEATPEDDVCFLLIGTKFVRCENKRLEEICDTTYNVMKGGDFYCAKGAKGNEFHYYNWKTKQLSTETLDMNIQSIFRTEKCTVAVTKDKKMHLLDKSTSIRNTPLNFDDEARIINVTENQIFVVTQQTTSAGSETALQVYDHSLNLQQANKFYPKDGDDKFQLTNAYNIKSVEGNSYILLEYSGARTPLVLKKVTDAKYAAPRMKNPNLPGVSRFSELRIKANTNTAFVGTGRKIYEFKLIEADQPESKDAQAKAPRDSNLVLSAMYKDQLSRVKRGDIKTKEMGDNNLLSRVIANPLNPDQIYFAKNDKANVTSILKFNFNTQSELSAVKEMKKPEKTSYIVDMVLNKDSKFCAVDDNGLIYLEGDNDFMTATDLMTFPRSSSFNTSRSRQIAVNESKTKAYFPTDDGDDLFELDILKAGTYKVLNNSPHGIMEVKCSRDDTIFGVRTLHQKGKSEYYLFKYDIPTQKLVEEVSIGLAAGYHFEALRLVSDQKLLVVANKRSAMDPKSGTSSEMSFALFTSSLDREFLSEDTPVSNKFAHCNVVDVMTTLQNLPIIILSKAATVYLLAIESDTKIKQIDAINFSEADGPNSTIESACYVDSKLYVVRNKNDLHRVEFKEL